MPHGRSARDVPRWLFALLALHAVGCGAVRSVAAPSGAAPAVALAEQRDGTWRVVGQGQRDGNEALQDAMRRAESAARQRGQRMTPLRVEPLPANAAMGAPFACALTFRMEPLPKVDVEGDHSFSAFEHRMRLRVEEGVLTIEEYSRLLRAHPGFAAQR